MVLNFIQKASNSSKTVKFDYFLIFLYFLIKGTIPRLLCHYSPETPAPPKTYYLPHQDARRPRCLRLQLLLPRHHGYQFLSRFKITSTATPTKDPVPTRYPPHSLRHTPLATPTAANFLKITAKDEMSVRRPLLPLLAEESHLSRPTNTTATAPMPLGRAVSAPLSFLVTNGCQFLSRFKITSTATPNG